jgi:hypothetical protein
MRTLTDDEKICKQLIEEIIEFGYPMSDYQRCLDWMVQMDILVPPDSEPKWDFGSEFKKFKAYLYS